MISEPQETNQRHATTTWAQVAANVCRYSPFCTDSERESERLGVKKIVIGVNEVRWQSPRSSLATHPIHTAVATRYIFVIKTETKIIGICIYQNVN